MKIFKKLKEAISFILKPTEVIFRVIDIFEDTTDNQIKARYHAVGKRISTVERIKSIVKALVHVQGFSDKDSVMILNAYEQQNLSTPLSLESVLFNEEGPVFLIRDNDSNEKLILSMNTIENNIEIIRQFNQVDSKAIIMLVFNSLFSKEATKIRELSNNKNESKILHIR